MINCIFSRSQDRQTKTAQTSGSSTMIRWEVLEVLPLLGNIRDADISTERQVLRG